MRAKRIAVYGLLTALALIFGYLESLVPPLFAVPGMKLGLSNIVVMVALYAFGPLDALLLNFIRIGINAILFGRGVGFFYAFAGGLLSGLIMIVLKKLGRFGMVAVSIVGGLAHNVGQLVVAMILMGTGRIFYYLPFLWASGMVSGALIGFFSGVIVSRLPMVRKPAKETTSGQKEKEDPKKPKDADARHLMFLVMMLALVMTSCKQAPAVEEPSTRTILAMDTIMELTVYGENAEEALSLGEAEIHRLDALLSSEEEKSEIARLNQKETVILSEDTRYLIDRSLALYEQTGGLFDISIYPLMELWGFPTKEYRIPSEEEIQTALEKVGADRLAYDPSSFAMTLKDGQKIDLGGIGKGYTSQRVIELMEEAGVSSAMVSLGGNVQVLGSKPDGSFWKIGIQDPLDTSGIAGVVEVKNAAVITSGGYRRYFEDEATGQRFSHILDPFTGWPAENDLSSVTIICADGVLGDGLSTSVFLMGKDNAIHFWKETDLVFQMVLIDQDGKIYATEGLKDHFSSAKTVEWIGR